MQAPSQCSRSQGPRRMSFITKHDLKPPTTVPARVCELGENAVFCMHPDHSEPRVAARPNQWQRSSAGSRSLHFASLALGLRGGGQADDVEKEGKTGVEFPRQFCHLSRSNCPELAGVGVRRKKLMGMKNIDAYALGFYLDQQAAKKLLSPKYSGMSAAALKQDPSLCNDVIEANDLEKTVRIVITSGMVNHDKFVNGLKDSLVPACQKAGDTASLPHFEQLFEGTQFRKGLELAFTSTKSGGLAARIDNRDVGEVAAPAFTRAFFRLYLGSDPVSPDGKASISQQLANLVSQSGAAEQETGES